MVSQSYTFHACGRIAQVLLLYGFLLFLSFSSSFHAKVQFIPDLQAGYGLNCCYIYTVINNNARYAQSIAVSHSTLSKPQRIQQYPHAKKKKKIQN
jgi:hypothetical protein